MSRSETHVVPDLQYSAVAVRCSRVVISCSNTCPVPVPAYSQRTCHSTLLGVLGQCFCRSWCRILAI
jgi:hypothetical protein